MSLIYFENKILYMLRVNTNVGMFRFIQNNVHIGGYFNQYTKIWILNIYNTYKIHRR